MKSKNYKKGKLDAYEKVLKTLSSQVQCKVATKKIMQLVRGELLELEMEIK